MTEYTELKRLANHAIGLDDSAYIPCQVAFQRAANPHSVLALIAENERLESDHGNLVLRNKVLRERPDLPFDRIGCHDQVIALQAERDQLRAEVAGLKTGYEAYERVNAELKAENEALRKALTDILDLYDTDEGCRSLPQYMAGRAALGKGEQS